MITMRVAEIPPKPLLVFDGDCGFCRMWIERWKLQTGEQVTYAPFQAAAGRFPEIPIEAFRRAAQLVDVDGEVYSGAEAVFRTLAHAPGKRWLHTVYRYVPGFGAASRAAYRFVASHRPWMTQLTRWLWGDSVLPSSFVLSRWLFLRLLGVIYLIAFLSMGSQVQALVGSEGIVPAAAYMERVHERLGGEGLWRVPTVAWWNADDTFLALLCQGGAVLSLLLVFDVAPAIMLALLWGLYLSLTSIGPPFTNFQWDILLLETGFLAIFLAPLRLRRRVYGDAPPSRIVLWLFRWLLFRLMFLSGLVKIMTVDASGEAAIVGPDDPWRSLTALTYHYWTQPLPLWTSWHVHHLPLWWHKFTCGVMFVIELGLPLLLAAPRRLRYAACSGFVLLMVLIGATGNYNFFNLLTIALCVLSVDDAWWRRAFRRGPSEPAVARPPRPSGKWLARLRLAVLVLLAAVVLPVSLVQGLGRLRVNVAWPAPVARLTEWTAPFRSVNAYGLFQRMTTGRREIIFEGSDDGATWLPYVLHWQPGPVDRAPGWCQPHQPRVDWQMWFAALGNYQRNPWLVALMRRTLEGSPAVLRLYEVNPFPERPPRHLRAIIYNYRFTTPEERRATGNWWHREYLGPYAPTLSRRE